MRFAINTPNGNIGRAVAQQLLAAQHDVRILSRTPEKAADLVAAGAELVTGSMDDADAVRALVDGVDAVFWVSPPTFRDDFFDWVAATSEQAARIVSDAGAKVVLLSSVGAQVPAGTGPIASLHLMENAFRASVADVTVLRPAYFAENFFGSLSTIVGEGVLYHAAPEALRMPIVATRDIAAVAVAELLAGPSGHRVRGVHGPEDLTFAEAAAQIGAGIGRQVTAVAIPPSALEQALLGAGLPPLGASLYAEMFDAMHTGVLAYAEERTAETTTPTTIRAFAEQALRPAIEAAA